MPEVCEDESRFRFPPLEAADSEGLLLIGGKVTAPRVLEAYAKGIFPWYDNDLLPLWWSPDPRFVLFPHELHVSRSMKKVLAKTPFEFRVNTAFDEVMDWCGAIPRNYGPGTWLTPQMKRTYRQLHRQGHAHSAEAWHNGELVGGVYGLRIGRVFFGESMFSRVSNASKFAFIRYVEALKEEGLALVDCQVYSAHVESLGARLIPRPDYFKLLEEHL